MDVFVNIVFPLILSLLYISVPIATLIIVILIFNKVKKIEKSIGSQ